MIRITLSDDGVMGKNSVPWRLNREVNVEIDLDVHMDTHKYLLNVC